MRLINRNISSLMCMVTFITCTALNIGMYGNSIAEEDGNDPWEKPPRNLSHDQKKSSSSIPKMQGEDSQSTKIIDTMRGNYSSTQVDLQGSTPPNETTQGLRGISAHAVTEKTFNHLKDDKKSNYVKNKAKTSNFEFVEAQNEFILGNMFFQGKDVKKDLKFAARLWRMAANKGVVEAQFNLGVIYEKGEGVEKNASEATAVPQID